MSDWEARAASAAPLFAPAASPSSFSPLPADLADDEAAYFVDDESSLGGGGSFPKWVDPTKTLQCHARGYARTLSLRVWLTTKFKTAGAGHGDKQPSECFAECSASART